MLSRPIPRFSPTFSPLELREVFRSLSPKGAGSVSEFEAAFSSYIGTKHAVMTSSARVSFYLLLEAWGLGPGDEILIPAWTYFAVPSAAMALGVKPVFVDVGIDTYVMDPEDLARKITPRSKVIVPTHLYGLPCDMSTILDIARAHKLKVVEDVAQATGARYDGKRLGSFGDAAYYTFGLTKNITTLKGAMVTTNDEELDQAIRQRMADAAPACRKDLLKEAAVGTAMMMVTRPWFYPFSLYPLMRLQGRMGRDYLEEGFGEAVVRYDEPPSWFFSGSPVDLQASVGLKQLSRLEGLNSARSANGRYLMEHLAHAQGFIKPKLVPKGEPIFMSFPIQVEDPEAVKAKLLSMGVDTARGYMQDCSNAEIYKGRVGGEGTCPNAAQIHAQILHIPVHPNLSRADLSHIVEAVRRATAD